jgi:hypothetical protein
VLSFYHCGDTKVGIMLTEMQKHQVQPIQQITHYDSGPLGQTDVEFVGKIEV